MSTKESAIDLTQSDEKKYPEEDLETDEELFEDEAPTEPYVASPVSPPKKKLKNNARVGNGKHWLLTYPALTYEQASKTKVAERIDELWGCAVQYSCVAREKHEDGTPHIHVFLTFDKKKQFRARGELDTLIPGGKHGDYKCMRFGSTDKMMKYVKKDKNWTEKGVYISDSCNSWTQAINADSNEAALEILKVGQPREFVVYNSAITQTFSKLHPKPLKPWQAPVDLSPWSLPAEVQGWLAQEYTKKDRPKCLVLVGDSRTGKTTWARSVTPDHLYMRGELNMVKLSTPAKLLILDDCKPLSMKSFPYRKQLLTAMGEATVTDKYRKKMDIIINYPCIVLANTAKEVPWCTDSEHEEYNYWKVNSVYIDIENNKLF